MYLVRQLRLHIFERFSDLHQDQQVSFLLIDVWNIPVEYGAIFIDELPHVGCDLTAMVFQFGLFQFCHFAPPERFGTEQLYTLTEPGAPGAAGLHWPGRVPGGERLVGRGNRDTTQIRCANGAPHVGSGSGERRRCLCYCEGEGFGP